MDVALQRIEREGLTWYEFNGPGPAFRSAMLTRLGGVSSPPFAALNLSATCGDSREAVAENHHRVFTVLGLVAESVVTSEQVHGNTVACVGRAHGGKAIPATDALMTNEVGVALLLRFADCVPVLAYDLEHHAVGLAHAGWRGVAAGVVPALVSAMAQRFGTRPHSLWTGIGPAIGARHYAVGPEVVTAVARALPAGYSAAELHAGQWYLDLPGAVKAQLQALGVVSVSASGLDTAACVAEWYSHRAEHGQTGRFGVIVALA